MAAKRMRSQHSAGRTRAVSAARVTARLVGPWEELPHSDDIALLELLSQVKAAKEEGAHVDGLEVALQHHLCHSSPHSRGMLEPMTTEACSKVHVDNQWVGAHHAILVKSVVVIIASPGAPNLWVHKMQGFLGELRHVQFLLRDQLLRVSWDGSNRYLSSCEVEET
jgi:hypothetical protein